MGVGPEKEEVVLQKEKKSKNKRTKEVGENRVGSVMDDKEYKRKEKKDKKEKKEKKDKDKKEKKVESIKESELNFMLEKDNMNDKDQLGGKKKKRKLESNERNNGLEFILKEGAHNLKKVKGDKLKKKKCTEQKKENKKRTKLVNNVEEKRADETNLKMKDSGGSTSGHSKDFEAKKSSKRVKFSGHDEVFPSSDATVSEEEHAQQKLVCGKRFSKEEDQMIKDAVYNFIEVHGLGENGLNMVLNCKSFPETRGCWKEIASALPWRLHRTIYWRAHNLLTRGELYSWTAEEKAFIMKFVSEKGPDWTTLAKILGKNRIHIKDIWRQMKFPNLKKGHWSQDEYQELFGLVNLDLQMKVHEEKKTKHGMLRENIGWTAISENMGTRTSSVCCRKWYHQLTSSMVKTGEWDDSDDYRLLDELLGLDACCMEDVDWDNLIDKRSGEVCLKRWKQMCLHIGNHGIKPFAEQVEVLARRYCPNLLEVRETLDSRPIVD